MPLRTPYHMLMRPMALARVSAKEAALVLIDVQDFMTAHGQGLDAEAVRRGIAREFGEYYDQVASALRNIGQMLEVCRSAGIAVFHVRVSSAAGLSRQFEQSGLARPTSGAADDAGLGLVAAVPGERVIERGAYSAFYQTTLESELRDRGVTTIILAGMMANLTVALAAREAADRDFDILVVQDACASETLGWHAAAMQGLTGGAIRIVATGDILKTIGRGGK